MFSVNDNIPIIDISYYYIKKAYIWGFPFSLIYTSGCKQNGFTGDFLSLKERFPVKPLLYLVVTEMLFTLFELANGIGRSSFFHLLAGHMGVYLCRTEVFVSEDIFEHTHIDAFLIHKRCRGVAQFMG